MAKFLLSTQGSILLALIISALFVFGLYIWPQKYHRNHPTCIKQRIVSAVAVTVLSPLLLLFLVSDTEDPPSLGELVGLSSDPMAALVPLLLTIILFSGPLFQVYLGDEPLLSDDSLLLLRNIVVAPITEEMVYRGYLTPVLFPILGWKGVIALQPLFFGVAHLHHAVELFRAGTAVSHILFSLVFKTAYTSIFGAFSCYSLLSTGSIFGPIISHAFCNTMGFPDFSGIKDASHPKLLSTVYLLGLTLFVFMCPTLLDCQSFSSIYC